MTMLIPTRRKKQEHNLGLGHFPTISSWLDEFFNDDFDQNVIRNFNKGISLPAVNVLDKDDEFIVEMAIPGMKKTDFNINVEDQVLTISAETENESSEENENYTRREFGYSSFKRTFSLPKTVDSDKISATYKDGILRVDLPKLDEARKKPLKTIEIS